MSVGISRKGRKDRKDYGIYRLRRFRFLFFFAFLYVSLRPLREVKAREFISDYNSDK